jgi:hypothetical protein
MAKVSGLPTKVQVDDSGGTLRDISNDITNITFSTPRGVQEVTGLNKSAIERILLLADATVTLNGVFNSATNQQHDVFKTVPSTSVVRTVTIDLNPTTTGAPRLSMEMLFANYTLTRSATGELTWSAEGSLADGTVPTWSTVP